LTRTETVARVLLGAIFIAAGMLKIADPAAFALAIARMQILPKALIGPAAIVLPWVELVSGAALLALPDWRRASLAVLGSLLGIFTIALIAVLIRGTSAHCGCFGTDGGVLGRTDVALLRNLVLLALAAISFRRAGRPTTAGRG
jgi:putative oxidoreductase